MTGAEKVQGKALIRADSLPDILAMAGIDTRAVRPQPGASAKVICPACTGGRTREKSLSITIDDDGAGARWMCHRPKCPGSDIIPGGGRVRDEAGTKGRSRDWTPPPARAAAPVRPKLDPPEAMQHRPADMLDWFHRRGISEETVAEFGIYATARWFPQSSTEKPAIAFPYRWRGGVVNRKFRSPDKEFAQDKGAARTLFNIDAVSSDDVVVIVEGELDVLACWESGLRQVVSLPDGAPGNLRDEDDPAREGDKRFEALTTCADVLAPVAKIIIATDADTPGGYLAEELARRLGRARCWRVRWPDGVKDANEMLIQHGGAALMAAVEAAEPWPLAGIADLRPGALAEYRRSNLGPRGLTCGIADLDAVAKLPAGGGWLTVLTGVPSHGKSTLLRAWLVNLASRHDLGVIYASPEDNRAENLALDLAAIRWGAPWRTGPTMAAMSDEDLTAAEAWVRDHFSFIASDDPDTEMTIGWVLARAEEVKRRHARQLLVLDPWNEFEHQFERGETETQYVGKTLRRLKAWGRAEGIGILIAAHPRILVPHPSSGLYPVANGYDIAGSANWFNRADLGLTAYRREEGIAELHCWKARFPVFGERARHARLALDRPTGRLRSTGSFGADAAGAPSRQKIAF